MNVVAIKRPVSRETSDRAGIALGVVMGEAAGGWRVRHGRTEQPLQADPCVDPALLREAAATGARVVLDASADGPPVIVGVIATRRALTVDPDGAVEARVRRFSLTASEEATLAGPGAFVRLKLDDVELYGRRVISRARELYRVLGRMVKIN
jgi:hypothetical protein